MDSQTIPLKPERLAELKEYAQLHGQTPADALDDLLAAQLEFEKQDYEETVVAVMRADEEIKAGRTMPAEEVLDELRAKYGFPR